MNFKDAFTAARQGAAIARPHWEKCLFFFFQHERLWKLSRSGSVRVVAMIAEACAQADDWYVVEGARIPALPVPKPKPAPATAGRGKPLRDRQAAMRARWGRKV